jgi:hypothetical protein
MVRALARKFAEQEAVTITASTHDLRCDELDSWHDEGTVTLVVAPVLIDTRIDEKGTHWSQVPAVKTWRVVALAPRTSVHTTLVSAADSADNVTAKGKRSKIRVALTDEDFSMSGVLDVEGCGEVPYRRMSRLQPDIDVRIGDRRLAIRGAIYRHEKQELTLSSAPFDCTGAETGDALVILGRNGSISFLGDAFASSYGFRSGFGANVANPSSPDAGGATSTVTIGGEMAFPGKASDPADEVQRRSPEHQVKMVGHVDALLCP